MTEQTTLFSQMDLPETIQAALARMNYTTATPVQAQSIPHALAGKDVLGSAQTGTGKTAAFSIPVVARLLADPDAMALILTPTRELAAQITTVVDQLVSQNRELKTALLIGGESYRRQFDQLRRNPRLIIGTPGRINDHLRNNGALLENVTMVVLDEADRMLDMGFSVQIDEILEHVQQERQTLMFSATFADGIIKFARRYLVDPVRVSVNPQQISAKNISREIVETNEANRYDALTSELDKRTGSVIVFVRTQHGVERLTRKLDHDNHDVDMLHGGLRQRQRDRAIATFRAGKTRIMIATDVAARGLDVPHIETVINYDLPQNPDDYVHRIGRTARAGAAGTAVDFLMPSERGKWAAIERLMNPDAPKAKGGRGGFDAPKGKGKGAGGFKGRKSEGGKSFGGEGGKRFGNEGGKRFGGNSFGGKSERKGEGARGYIKNEGQDFFGDREDRQALSRPSKERSFGDRPYGDRPSKNRSSNGRPSNDRPFNDRPAKSRPFAKKQDGDRFDRAPRDDRRSDNRGDNRNDNRGDRWQERSADKPFKKSTPRSAAFAEKGRSYNGDSKPGMKKEGGAKFGAGKPTGSKFGGGKATGSKFGAGKPAGKKFEGRKPGGAKPANGKGGARGFGGGRSGARAS